MLFVLPVMTTTLFRKLRTSYTILSGAASS